MKTGRLTTRFLGGPALRFQPDRRLVSLVRDGYESAFEEIFRRYGAALRGYAASIVTAQRADDVTQEAFTKAYLALAWHRQGDPASPLALPDRPQHGVDRHPGRAAAGARARRGRAAGMSPEELAEQREEIGRLMAGLRELPEPQRAAIVMRELEGLSHEQIAASLGLSGGAVRQSIYRARRALRDGVGMLVPMPLLRLLLEEGFTQGASAAAAGGGAGIAVKAGVAALLAAGTVTTGAVMKHELKSPPKADANATRASGRRGGWRPHPRGRLAQRRGGNRRTGLSRGGTAAAAAAEAARTDGTSGHRGSNSGPGSEHSGTGSEHSGLRQLALRSGRRWRWRRLGTITRVRAAPARVAPARADPARGLRIERLRIERLGFAQLRPAAPDQAVRAPTTRSCWTDSTRLEQPARRE